jgi:hypothetical protein
MTVAHVEVIVEEPSAEVALREILPRMLGSLGEVGRPPIVYVGVWRFRRAPYVRR